MTARSRGARLGAAACTALLLAIGCQRAGVASAAADERDVAIYRAVLAGAESRLVVRTTSAPLEVGEMTTGQRIAMHARDLPGLDPSTVRSFQERNRVSEALPALGGSGVETVAEEEWQAHADSDEPRWNRGVMILSRIGYSREGTQALVYVVKACPLCGGAEYVLLARSGDRWAVVAKAGDWYS